LLETENRNKYIQLAKERNRIRNGWTRDPFTGDSPSCPMFQTIQKSPPPLSAPEFIKEEEPSLEIDGDGIFCS
jgi:hypothetical protein